MLEKTWTARRSNQSILKEINTKYSLEGLILKLKLQYFNHLMQRVDSSEKYLILGKIEGRRRRRRYRMRWLDRVTDSKDVNLSKPWEIEKVRMGTLACCSPWVCKESDMTNNWTMNQQPNGGRMDFWKHDICTVGYSCEKEWNRLTD